MAEGKTAAMRLLDQRKIKYQVLRFPEEIHDAAGVARQTGVDPARVFKTLVVEDAAGTKRRFLIMVPGDSELDLKKTAEELGMKKVCLASYKDAEAKTGLKVGGISAPALLGKSFEIWIAIQAAGYDWIVVSAGQRGVNLKISVQDLVDVTGARWLDCC